MKIHFGHYNKVMFFQYFLTDLFLCQLSFQAIESSTFCWKFFALDFNTTYCLGITVEAIL